jgi:hypothetical protein
MVDGALDAGTAAAAADEEKKAATDGGSAPAPAPTGPLAPTPAEGALPAPRFSMLSSAFPASAPAADRAAAAPPAAVSRTPPPPAAVTHCATMARKESSTSAGVHAPQRLQVQRLIRRAVD